VLAAVAVVCGSPTAAVGATCAVTHDEGRNGNYRPGAPVRASMGKGHVLVGVVRSADNCGPVGRARLEFFQSGPQGYSTGKSWAHRATVFTRADGSYRLEGAYPSSTGPPPHIHMRVTAPGFEALNTTFFPRAGALRSRLVLVLEPLA
jgi:protocatechuate 3,4-dioxygenase beta subunit